MAFIYFLLLFRDDSLFLITIILHFVAKVKLYFHLFFREVLSLFLITIILHFY